MMQENYLKLLELESKKYKKNKDLFDIVLYGSVVKGKRRVNDFDVLLIFIHSSLEERVKIVQSFKNNLKLEKLDIKTINLSELFDKNFLARQGIILEGVSLIDKRPIREKLGFESFGLFKIETKNLSNTKKVKFSYSLNGRREEKGFLKKVEGEKISQQIIQIPIKNLDLFKEYLENLKINYKLKQILVPNYK